MSLRLFWRDLICKMFHHKAGLSQNHQHFTVFLFYPFAVHHFAGTSFNGLVLHVFNHLRSQGIQRIQGGMMEWHFGGGLGTYFTCMCVTFMTMLWKFDFASKCGSCIIFCKFWFASMCDSCITFSVKSKLSHVPHSGLALVDPSIAVECLL